MTPSITVREAGPAAGAAVAALERACFDAPWTDAAVRSLLDDGLTRVWEASTPEASVGAALVRVVAGEGELLRIAVHPDARRQGIGRVLLRAVLSAVADACPLGVYLEVRASNVAARRLYAREGFVERGRRRAYYEGPREDAILMHWQPVVPAPDGH